MIISKYSFLFDINNSEFYMYNSLSNALFEIDKSYYRILDNLQKNKVILDESVFDPEFTNLLKDNYFLTDNIKDDYLVYKSIIMTQRNCKTQMHLTIAPTMDCCFNCHYCFEKYKVKNYMTPEIMDNIVKYLNSLTPQPDYHITWFGGEPLMAVNQIEQLYNKLIDGFKKPFKSNIITTGYHINKDIIKILKKIEISQVQITLDGLKESHNKVKFTQGNNDVFSTTLDNIELLLQESSIYVAIRVNITKENSDQYVELYNLLHKRFKNYNNFSVNPAFVLDRGKCESESCDKSVLFSHKEKAEFVKELYYLHDIYSSYLQYPERFFNECAIKNDVAISFDPEGYAYKCWEIIGNKEYSIGKLNSDGGIGNINYKVLNRQLYGADILDDHTCSQCKYLPICHGGCPIQRIENEFECGKNCSCTHYKGCLEEFLKIHINYKNRLLK